MTTRYFARVPASSQVRINAAKAKLHKAKAQLMIATKCQKYGVERYKRRLTELEGRNAVLNIFAIEMGHATTRAVLDGDLAALDKVAGHARSWMRATNVQTRDGLRDQKFLLSRSMENPTSDASLTRAVRLAKAKVSRRTSALSDARGEARVARRVDTTVQNADAAAAIQAFFAAHDASRIFDDVVRPWCSRAILALPNRETHWSWAIARCNECHVICQPESIDYCRHCSVRLCGICIDVKENSHLCPVTILSGNTIVDKTHLLSKLDQLSSRSTLAPRHVLMSAHLKNVANVLQHLLRVVDKEELNRQQ